MFEVKEKKKSTQAGKEGTVSPSATLASGDFLFPFSSAHFVAYATAYFPLLPCQSRALRPPLFAGSERAPVPHRISHFPRTGFTLSPKRMKQDVPGLLIQAFLGLLCDWR